MTDEELVEFVDGLYHSYERWFIHDEKRYILFCWEHKGKFGMSLDQTEPEFHGLVWVDICDGDKRRTIIDEFLTDKIFDGKSFLDIANDVKWIEAWE